MKKYLNVILLSFFGIYFLKYDIKLILVLPILYLYMIKDKKNILIVSTIMSISIFLYDKKLIPLIIIILLMCAFSLVLKAYKTFTNSLLIILVNFIIFITLDLSFELKELIIYIIYSLISAVIYIILERISRKKYLLIESYLALIVIFGSNSVGYKNIDLSFMLSLFYIMTFIKNKQMNESIILLVFLYFIFGSSAITLQNELLYIYLIAAIYMLPGLSNLIVLSLVMVLSLVLKELKIEPIVITQITFMAIFTEVFKPILVYTFTDEELYKKIYETQIQRVNNDVSKYASFLDNFSKKHVESKEYKLRLSQGVNTLISNYCNSCYKKNECFKMNKGKLFYIHKDLLLYSKKDDLNEASVLTNYCPTLVEMRKSALLINQNLKISDEYKKKNSLVSEIKGITSILNQYTISNSLIEEIEYNKIKSLQQKIKDAGLSLCYFNPKSIFKNDYLIELGFRYESFSKVKEQLEKIASEELSSPTTLLYKESNLIKSYFNLVPKINCDITYGYAKHAEETNSVCGDNFLIKKLNDSRMVSVICDGMGKGVYANSQSSDLINMIKEILDLELMTSVAIQTINTLYNMEDYLEKYSTLDYLEINRSTKKASFYKMGSASSYIIKESGKLIKVENQSLPFGLEEMTSEKEYDIECGDIIIMSSDGVIDNVIEEKDFEKYIKQIKHLTSQKMAYEIMSYAMKTNLKASDDKCVIVLKIENPS